MDTQACLRALIDHIHTGESGDAFTHASNLLMALLAGMPAPTTTPNERHELACFLADMADEVTS